MDPIVEIPCAEEIIHVGLFSLGAYKSHEFNNSGITRGILARSIKYGKSGSQFRGTAMEVETRKEEEDVLRKAGKATSLTDGDKAQENTAISDTKGRGKLGRWTDEGILSKKKSGEGELPRESMSDGRIHIQ